MNPCEQKVDPILLVHVCIAVNEEIAAQHHARLVESIVQEHFVDAIEKLTAPPLVKSPPCDEVYE